MGFSRQEYWNALPCPPPGDLPGPGIEPGLVRLLHWQGFFTTSVTWEALWLHICIYSKCITYIYMQSGKIYWNEQIYFCTFSLYWIKQNNSRTNPTWKWHQSWPEMPSSLHLAVSPAVGRMVLQDVYAPIPGICEFITLHGKGHFADVIKVTDLERARVSWIVQVGRI